MIEPDNLGALPDGVLCQQQKAKVSTDISMNSTFPKVFIAGHRGMVGSAIYRHLINSGLPKDNLITKIADLDLTCQQDTNRFFEAILSIRFIWLRRRLAAYTQTTHTLPSSSMKT